MDKPTYPLKHFKSAREWHIYHVYNDPEFRADMLWLAANENAENMQTIEAKYAITEDDLNFYHLGYDEMGRFNTDLQYSAGIDDEGHVVITLDPGFTKADLEQVWNELERDAPELVATKNKRHRAPENHQLIYAVFRARQHRTTFKEIFNEYTNGRLAYYVGGNNQQFQSEDDLEKYYGKHKPRR